MCVSACAVESEAHVAASAEPTSTTVPEIVLVVEEGSVIPTLLFHGAGNGAVWGTRAASRTGDLEQGGSFEILGGGLRFAETASSTAVARECDGALALPAIAAPDDERDSFVQLMVGGQRVGQPLRLAVRAKGTIGQITSLVPAGDPSYVALGAEYALVDTKSYEAKASDRGHAGALQSGGGSTTSAVCLRSPIGPGWVEWQNVDPWLFGYSVKPETSNFLIYGHLPSESCDGIYNLEWGCGVALKVPDHCTFYVGDWTYCCNAAMIPFYGVVRWVYPGSGGEATEWPSCPLP
jgi:hypothetical protein